VHTADLYRLQRQRPTYSTAPPTFSTTPPLSDRAQHNAESPSTMSIMRARIGCTDCLTVRLVTVTHWGLLSG